MPPDDFTVSREQQAAIRYLRKRNQVCKWLKESKLMDVDAKEDDVARMLSDGVMLCRLASHVSGEKVDYLNIHTQEGGKRDYRGMENLHRFLVAIKKAGVKESDLFEPENAYNERNTIKVVHCIQAFAQTEVGHKAEPPLDADYMGEFTPEDIKLTESLLLRWESKEEVDILPPQSMKTKVRSGRHRPISGRYPPSPVHRRKKKELDPLLEDIQDIQLPPVVKEETNKEAPKINTMPKKKHWTAWVILLLAFATALVGVYASYQVVWVRKADPIPPPPPSPGMHGKMSGFGCIGDDCV